MICSNNLDINDGYFSAGLNISILQEREGGPNGMYDYIEQGENITIITTVDSLGDIQVC